MKIITWNINSIRLRFPLLAKLAAEENPEIICLQEIKAANDHFPLDDVRQLGYTHTLFNGEKGYNGVALLSRVPLGDMRIRENIGGMPHARHIAATLPNGAELHNFYVPAGGDIPDAEQNPAYGFKLRFVEEMAEWFSNKEWQGKKMVLVGDLNIAPFEHDVWSHKQLLNVISHTPPETERMMKLYNTLDWVDVARHFVPQNEKLYSWWSYRNKDWKKSDRGRRLDHVWVTPQLKEVLRRFAILKGARDWEKPSDHVPVVVELGE